MDFLLLLAVVAVVVWFVGGPLRAGAVVRRATAEEAERAELEAAKEAKLDEIRLLELDWRTGKLDDAEYRAQDRALRGEAVALLKRLDALAPEAPDPAANAREG